MKTDTCMQMVQLSAANGPSVNNHETLLVYAFSVPEQTFVQGSYLELVIGLMRGLVWSVDDAIMRSSAMKSANVFVEQVVQQRHKYDAASLLMLEKQLRALQTAHMIPVEPTLIVPARQNLTLRVWSGPGSGRGGLLLGKPIEDSDLYVRLACSLVREVG